MGGNCNLFNPDNICKLRNISFWTSEIFHVKGKAKDLLPLWTHLKISCNLDTKFTLPQYISYWLKITFWIYDYNFITYNVSILKFSSGKFQLNYNWLDSKEKAQVHKSQIWKFLAYHPFQNNIVGFRGDYHPLVLQWIVLRMRHCDSNIFNFFGIISIFHEKCINSS